jgi:4-amino-4-deoxy-L-arabinose transferase-like glycosyltransferase
MLDGQVPYRDLFDNKPPLVYGWYALSFLLFGEHVAAPRIVASLLLSITTLALFAQARLLFPRGVAYLAATLFAVSTGVPFLALHANTEAYMLLPLVTSIAAFTVGMNSRRLGWFFLAGVLGALAIGTKQVAMWNLVALAVVALTWQWRTEGTREGLPAASLPSAPRGPRDRDSVSATGAIDELLCERLTTGCTWDS